MVKTNKLSQNYPAVHYKEVFDEIKIYNVDIQPQTPANSGSKVFSPPSVLVACLNRSNVRSTKYANAVLKSITVIAILLQLDLRGRGSPKNAHGPGSHSRLFSRPHSLSSTVSSRKGESILTTVSLSLSFFSFSFPFSILFRARVQRLTLLRKMDTL